MYLIQLKHERGGGILEFMTKSISIRNIKRLRLQFTVSLTKMELDGVR